MRKHVAILSGLLMAATALAFAQRVPAQQTEMPAAHVHTAAMAHGTLPLLPGQDAFGAVQEIVRILEADPATDWSKVNLEGLRQHLIDMNEVTLHAEVQSRVAPAGLVMEVTGGERTEAAIRRMVVPHTAELNRLPEWTATAENIPSGIRLTVLAKSPDDAKTVARIRGLGFIGLLAQGAHHQAHHLAMARGEAIAAHGH
jgi:hypothetical protein